MARLKRGQLITVNGTKAIVLSVGRERSYSAVVYKEDGSTPLITEVPWWIEQGNIKPGPVNAHRVRWARDYCATHDVLELR